MAYKEVIITDYGGFKENVDKKCKEAKEKLGNAGEHGNVLRDRIIELNSVLSNMDELVDHARLLHDLQKARMSKVEALAMVKLLNEDEFKKIPATLKKFHLDIVEFEYKGEVVSLNEEKVRLAWNRYAMNRFISTHGTIENAIMGCQSALKYDMEELKRLNYT